MSAPRKAGIASIVAVLGALGCGSSDASHTQYELGFETTGAAVATDGIKIYVFDRSQPKTDCASLVALRRAGTPFPPSPTLVYESPLFRPCDLLAGAPATQLSLGFGDRAIVAVGVSKGKDLLIGCNQGTFADGTEPIPIPLGTADVTVIVPATTCTQLSEHCEGKCQ
jgi:hypothetical protein